MRIVFGDNLKDVVFVQDGDIAIKTSLIHLPGQQQLQSGSSNMKVSKVVHDPSGVYQTGDVIAHAFLGIQNFNHDYLEFAVTAVASRSVIGKVVLDESKEEFRPFVEISKDAIERFKGDRAQWSGGRDMTGLSGMDKASTIIMPS